MAIATQAFFDHETSTFTYVVVDEATKKAAIIDSVLNYDMYSGCTSTQSADQIIAYAKEHSLEVEWILDTHIHADHLTASSYIKKHLGGKIGIGSKIKAVLAFWVPVFNTHKDTPLDGSQFDALFNNEDVMFLGNTPIKIWHTPGHTPACASFLMDDAVFVGDTIFMPDIGTARTDFPGGSAETMYNSVQKILSLPDATRIFMCHDYPPNDREISYVSTIKDQKEKNIMINNQISKELYIKTRNEKDKGKAVPKLLLPSIQVNLRAGNFGIPEAQGTQYIKIPVNKMNHL